jgi:hypothetical protein
MGIAIRRYVSPIYMISGADPETGRAFSWARCACVMATITPLDQEHIAVDGLLDSWHEWGAHADTCEAALTALRDTIAAESGIPDGELRTLPIAHYDYADVLQGGGVPIFADFLTRIHAEFSAVDTREET